MTATQFHEAADTLRAETREMHRAIRSLIEELDAVDWYAQRIDASDDAELAAVLAHNRDEEKEHACMVLEWIRRHDAKFDEFLRRFLFSDGPIAKDEDERAIGDGRGNPSHDGSLRVGSLRAAQVSRSSQGREAAAQRGEAERSAGPREGGKASEVHREREAR